MPLITTSSSSSSSMHHKRTDSMANKLNDVIVIGAGLSGLSAAKVCHDKGLNVLVVEARDRVGGRTLSDESGCDLGGSYFIQEHRNLFNLVAELGLRCQADLPASPGGVPVFYSNQHKSIRPFAGKFDLLVKLDYIAFKRKIDDLCNQIDLNEPWNFKRAKEFDAMPFKQYIESNCYTTQVRNYFINFIIPINLTNEAEDCSLLFALCFIRSWGGIERCIGMESSGGTSRVVGGSQLISKRLSQQIGEERVLLNRPVHTIDQQTNSELVSVITKDGTRYEASRVIVALPPNLQTTITFKPSIPLKQQLNHRTPAGLCTKVILYYDRAYWDDNGFNGHLNVTDHFIAGEDKKCRDGFRRGSSKKFGSRRSVCKTNSSTMDKMDDQQSLMYASTNSLLTATNAIGNSSSNNNTNTNITNNTNNNINNNNINTNINADRSNNLMLKETKESYYPQSGLTKLEDGYCPVSFVTPDYSRSQPALIAHICGSAWIKYHQVEKQEDRIALIAKSYARILHPNLAEPVSFKELDWVREEYSRGAYTSIMTPGTMTKFGRTLGAPFGRIAFACTEMSTYWPGTMEGAIRSGRKAALKILKDLQRLDVEANDIVDDEEVQIQVQDTFLERHANRLCYLTKLALTAPTLILLASIVGFSMHRVTFRCTLGI